MFDWIMEHFWTFMGGLIVILLALVGVLLYLRNQRPD